MALLHPSLPSWAWIPRADKSPFAWVAAWTRRPVFPLTVGDIGYIPSKRSPATAPEKKRRPCYETAIEGSPVDDCPGAALGHGRPGSVDGAQRQRAGRVRDDRVHPGSHPEAGWRAECRGNADH